MNIFEKLTEQDKTLITNYISTYAGDDGAECTMHSPLEHILRIWNESKSNLFNLLGESLIVKTDIDFKCPAQLIEKEISVVVDNHRDFFREYDHFVTQLCGEWDWRTPSNENSILRNRLETLVYISTLSENIYHGTTFSIPDNNGHEIKINRGCKVSKILGKIAKSYNLKYFEEFRVAHSMCFNQKNMHGHLCLSIHPLDFMTMSDNDSNWSSCMSWDSDGSYRQGTVEMMNSPYIVMAYLASEHDMRVPGGTWNNKKWRQLFVVTPELIMGIKSYPYRSRECEKIVIDMLKDMAQANLSWGPYTNNTVFIDNDCDNSFSEISVNSYVNLYMNHMYNDITNDHIGYINTNFPDSFELNLSGDSECMSCGDYIDEYENDNALICDRCSEGRIYCCCCGERIMDDEQFVFEDEYYCEDCYNREFSHCDYSDEDYPRDETVLICILCEGKPYNYTIRCAKQYLESKDFIKTFGKTKKLAEDNSLYGVDIANFSNSAWSYFFWGHMDEEKFFSAIKAGEMTPLWIPNQSPIYF